MARGSNLEKEIRRVVMGENFKRAAGDVNVISERLVG
jgi:hypothetical protein